MIKRQTYSMTVVSLLALLSFAVISCGRSDEPPPDDDQMPQVQPPMPTQSARRELPAGEHMEIKNDASGLQSVISKEGRFTVLMPGAPKFEQQKMNNLPDAFLYSVNYTDTATRTQYVVSYADRPKSAPPADNSDEQMKNLLNLTATQTFNGVPTSNKPIIVGAFRGREIVADLPKGGMYRSRLFFDGDRQYQLIVKSFGGDASAKTIDKFFESFKVVK